MKDEDIPVGARLNLPNGNRYEKTNKGWVDLTDCSGVAAKWCDIHGDCTCSPHEPVDYTCRLHSPLSSHAKDYL